MSRIYAYRCDGPDCREFAIPDLGIGDIRPGRSSVQHGTHYCLKHYPLARCSHCDHPMRPAKSLKKDWPGTKARGAEGLCSTCYLHLRNYGKLAESARPSRKAV